MSINRDEFTNFIDEFLMQEEAKELQIKITGEEEKDAPMIDSMQKANYFLKLVKNIEADMKVINELCDEEIKKTTDRVNAYKEAQLLPLARTINYYSKLLQNYAENQLIDSKKRSVKLPNGTLSISKQAPTYDYEDETIMDWLLQNKIEKYITTKIENKLDKREFKKAIELDDEGNAIIEGKVIPGLTITPKEDKFTIR